jgi:antitoxin component of MazEF toxin-antitoxin module
MTKNLVAIGNSLGIIIEKPILDLLKIERDTPLEITTDGDRLIIEPITNQERKRRVREASAWVMEKHKDTLRKLAE